MSWAPRFLLGTLGGEIEFPCRAMTYEEKATNVEIADKNLLGATFKSFQRIIVPDVAINFAQLPDGYMAILRGLVASLNPLNLIFNSSLAVKYFPALSTTTSSVVIPPTSATGIVITGVFLATDYTQTGTNYYSGGSFDATGGGTGLPTITLGSVLPGANTAVTVNFTYAGISCYAQLTAKPHDGVYSGYWQGSLTLSGA